MKPKRDRKSLRLLEYDYSQPGAYFVTICVDGREYRLGRILDGEMLPNKIGTIALEGWRALKEKFQTVEADIFCVMPNHVHAIISIRATRRGEETSPRGGVPPPLRRPKLGDVIAFYKYNTTKQINQLSSSPGLRFWQRNYYERVIRNEREYQATADYIHANPLKWNNDEYR